MVPGCVPVPVEQGALLAKPAGCVTWETPDSSGGCPVIQETG